jgi:hypothetical protein
VGDAKAEVGNAESVAIRSITGRGRSRRSEPVREAADHHDLPAEGKEDSKVSLSVRIAVNGLRFEMILIEEGRLLWLCGVDVNVI